MRLSNAIVQEIRLTEGPTVAAAKMSQASNIIALQRSPGHLQFMDLASSKTFVQVSAFSLPPHPSLGIRRRIVGDSEYGVYVDVTVNHDNDIKTSSKAPQRGLVALLASCLCCS